MSIYSYPQSPVIDEVTFHKTANGGIRAYLHARNDTDPTTIQSIRQALKYANYNGISSALEGHPVIEVRGFKKEAQLLGVLEKWLQGPPTITKTKEDNLTLWEKFRKRTLQFTGVSYIAGDVGLFHHGHKAEDALLKAGSFSYFLGTLALLFYGRNDQSNLQVHDLAKDMQQFLKQENIPIPQGSSLDDITRENHKGLLQTAHEFCKRYPSEIFNSVTALAGVFLAASAYKHKINYTPLPGIKTTRELLRDIHMEGWQDLALGTLTASSGVLATLVKEKKPDPDAPHPKGLSWVWEKIREHPLAIAGVGYTISTMFHAASTWRVYKRAKATGDKKLMEVVPGRALFVAAAFVSEFLLAISSKGHGEGVVNDKSVDNTTIAIAADLIARQPPSMQESLIAYLTGFLGQAKELALKDQDIAQQLREQVTGLRKNPWANIASTPDVEQQPAASVYTELAKKPLPDWQAKVAAQSEKGAQPAISG